jgi:tetratricopeptide (TPR) repeat protein
MSSMEKGVPGKARGVWEPGCIYPALLVCMVLFSGCGLFNKGGKGDDIALTPAEKEKAELLRTIDRRFENPDAHYQLGRLYQADGLWAQAETCYNTTLRFDPAHRDAQAGMVKVMLDSGNTARGELYADIYMNQVASSAMGSLQLGLGFQRQGLDEYALSCYQQSLGLAPNAAKVHRQIGYYYLSKNDKERARDYLMRSFQLNPNQPEVAGELGRLGVAVQIPRKVEKRTKKLDRAVEESDKQLQP